MEQIINGVDIFRDFFDYACDNCVGGYSKCIVGNCWAKEMYKQLQELQKQLSRKEEECEEWKGVASQYKLEKVKAQNRYQQMVGSYNRAENYKQALDEIEEVAKYYSKICHGAGGQSINIQDRHYCMSQVGKEILQIIQKVKGE